MMPLKPTITLFFVFILALHGCKESADSVQTKNASIVESGNWRFVMDLGDKLLPFNAVIDLDNSEPRFIVMNANEEIQLENVRFFNDSIKAYFPVFQSELSLRIESPSLLSGKWINHNKENYSIPVMAEYNRNFRFTPSKSSADIASKYKVVFDPNGTKPWNAILKVSNNEGKLEGTFLTETGDYRFLDGNIMNGKIYLSTFDGSHAFYFESDIRGDSLHNGQFLSGSHYQTSWLGSANQNFELRSPDDLTYIKKGYNYFDFSLPNQDGDTVSWNDLDLQGKVVIVDIMGSWCPNCLDANRSIQKLISTYNKEDIAVLTIAFEKTTDLQKARSRIIKMQEKLGLPEGFIFGGKANKQSASNAFPMLNHIMSYPTLIFIDKNREVRQIYTGFYGPGTGKYYDQFMKETDSLLQEMVNEQA